MPSYTTRYHRYIYQIQILICGKLAVGGNHTTPRNIYNDPKSGETSKLLEQMDSTDKAEVKSEIEVVEKSLDEWQKQGPISIYEGVDRDVFKSGVAVTSTAQDYSNGDGLTWADALVNSKVAKGAAIGVMVGATAFLTGAIIASRIIRGIQLEKANVFFDGVITIAKERGIKEGGFIKLNGIKAEVGVPFAEQPNKVKNAIIDTTFKNEENMKAYKWWEGEEKYDGLRRFQKIQKLRLGLCIAGITLAVADIVTTSIALYKYYNRDHLDIPSTMVDMSYNESKQTSFISYKNVLDNNGKAGDLNGGGGKQWLALYQTHDEAAGEPILAPENGENCDIIVRYGKSEELKSEEFSPLHMFGTPNTAQNLTFADGDNGWSYNDGKKGTYLLFHRASGAEDSVSTADTGTTTGTGIIAMIAILSCFVGFFLGFIVSNARKRHIKEKNKIE